MKWLKKESQSELESKYAKLAKEQERLEIKQALLERQKALRERQKEIKKLAHPYQEKIRQTTKTAGGRILGFTGRLIREGKASYDKTNRTMRRMGRQIRIRQQPSMRKSFVAPQGNDISLSASIARNDWHTKNIMDIDFFGNEQQKDLLGVRENKELIGGNTLKKEKKYY